MKLFPRLVISFLTLFLLTGCISFGPRDGQFYVVGSAPANGYCFLTVAVSDRHPSVRNRPVSGQFRESFVIGMSRNGHVATLVCNDAVVTTRRFTYGRDVRIGGELLL